MSWNRGVLIAFIFPLLFFLGFCFCCYKVLTWASQQMVRTNGGYLLPENEKRECAFINSDPEFRSGSYRTTVLVFVFSRVRIKRPAKIYSVLFHKVTCCCALHGKVLYRNLLNKKIKNKNKNGEMTTRLIILHL